MSGNSGGPGSDLVDAERPTSEGGSRRGAPPRGVRTLNAILPNGKVVWLRVDPPPASLGALTHLAQDAEQSIRWRRAATSDAREKLARLARRTAEDVERLSDAHVSRATKLLRLAATRRLATRRRLARAAAAHRRQVAAQLALERESLRRLERRELWDALVIATALPLFQAYGERGRPFGVNNLTLTVSLLIWLIGDELVDAIFGRSDASPYPVRDLDAWSYIAPAANVLTGWWLLGKRQHERFLGGRVELPPAVFSVSPDPLNPLEVIYRYEVRQRLDDIVAKAHYPDFETFGDVPVVASLSRVQLSAHGAASNARITSVTAHVDAGKLHVIVTAIADAPAALSVVDALEVAWLLDTNPAESAG